MNTENFAISELFSFGWAKTKEHFGFVFLVMVLAALAMAAARHSIVSIIVDMLISISTITVSLMIVRGGTPTWSDLFSKYSNLKTLWTYLVSSILVLLCISLGFIALILPGIYLLVRLQFYKYLVVDKETVRPTDALKQSMEMTKGKFWMLFRFILCLAGLNLLGAITIVGLIITIPVSMFASSLLYTKLLPQESTVVPVPPTQA